MKRFTYFQLPFTACLIAVVLTLSNHQARAERLVDDSFESFDENYDPLGWGRAGHPSYLRVANESEGNWTTPYGEWAMSTYSSGVGTKTIGYLPDDFAPGEGSGDFTAKFHISSFNTIGEYRAELWVNDAVNGWTLLGFTEGDTDGSKDFSFSDQITWRYEHDDWAVSGFSTIAGAEVQLRLMQDPNRSNWRNTPIWDNVTVDYVPDVDSTGPTVLDIVDDRQGGTVVATGSLVTYTVTFNEPMDGTTVGTDDFGNAGSAAATITSVTATADDAVFLVGVTPTGGGTLRLQIESGADLKDAVAPVGNPMDTSSAIQDNVTFTVESGTPTILPSDFVDDSLDGSVAENALVIYTLTFSKDMNDATVDVDDFGNAGSAPIDIGTITETTPGVFTVEVTPTGSGTLRLMINAGVTITAADGGVLNTGSAIVDDTTIIVDSDPPLLDYINDDAGGSPVVVGALLTYDVFFTEDMDASTVDIADFGNAITSGNATYTIDSLEEASPGVFRLEITTTGPGDIQLQINSGADIIDVTGNALDTTLALVDDVTITVEVDPYESWSGGELFDDDLNQDGMANGMAWLLGASGPGVNANSLKPTMSNTDAAYVIFYYQRSDEAFAAGAVAKVQYSQNLSGWDDASIGNDSQQGASVIVIVHDDMIATGIDQVEVKIHRSLVTGDRFFLKLDVTRP